VLASQGGVGRRDGEGRRLGRVHHSSGTPPLPLHLVDHVLLDEAKAGGYQHRR
jgi:hypothetical protein